MKTKKIIYWGSTGLVSALMLFSASMYLFNYEEIEKAFIGLGFPIIIIYPLAIAKILGVFAITSRKVDVLTEWAYAGFFFNLLLAAGAHYFVGEPFVIPLIAVCLLLTSYKLGRQVRGLKN